MKKIYYLFSLILSIILLFFLIYLIIYGNNSYLSKKDNIYKNDIEVVSEIINDNFIQIYLQIKRFINSEETIDFLNSYNLGLKVKKFRNIQRIKENNNFLVDAIVYNKNKKIIYTASKNKTIIGLRENFKEGINFNPNNSLLEIITTIKIKNNKKNIILGYIKTTYNINFLFVHDMSIKFKKLNIYNVLKALNKKVLLYNIFKYKISKEIVNTIVDKVNSVAVGNRISDFIPGYNILFSNIKSIPWRVAIIYKKPFLKVPFISLLLFFILLILSIYFCLVYIFDINLLKFLNLNKINFTFLTFKNNKNKLEIVNQENNNSEDIIFTGDSNFSDSSYEKDFLGILKDKKDYDSEDLIEIPDEIYNRNPKSPDDKIMKTLNDLDSNSIQLSDDKLIEIVTKLKKLNIMSDFSELNPSLDKEIKNMYKFSLLKNKYVIKDYLYLYNKFLNHENIIKKFVIKTNDNY